MILQEGHLCVRLDTFCDHGELQASGHADNRLGDDFIVMVAGDISDERTVNLQLVNPELLKIAEARISCAEIIDALRPCSVRLCRKPRPVPRHILRTQECETQSRHQGYCHRVCDVATRLTDASPWSSFRAP
jgi:hypothetical protein